MVTKKAYEHLNIKTEETLFWIQEEENENKFNGVE
jgi:hypothetical protein